MFPDTMRNKLKNSKGQKYVKSEFYFKTLTRFIYFYCILINMDNWKPMLQKQQKAQVIRIFRPDEVHALINNIDIRDESNWTKSRESKNLIESGFTTKDIQTWMEFLLYSGTRFSEALIIHEYRDHKTGANLYQGNGTIFLPRYKGKKLRSIQSRTIYLSYKGREVLEKFFETPILPAKDEDGVKQVLTSLGTIMHKAGERIKLPERTLEYIYQEKIRDENGVPIKEMVEISQFVKNPDGTYSKMLKENYKIKEIKKYVTTNGCTVRSFRKTWESWLTAHFSGEQSMRDRVINSQGHKKETAWTHYLDISFDQEDLKNIAEEVNGYGVID